MATYSWILKRVECLDVSGITLRDSNVLLWVARTLCAEQNQRPAGAGRDKNETAVSAKEQGPQFIMFGDLYVPAEALTEGQFGAYEF